jgi:predicted amidohydrolase
MRLALAQYPLHSEMGLNLAKALDFMAAAARRGAQLIIFPELCLSPFFPQNAGQDATRYAVTLEDECIRQFQAACLKLRLSASPNIYLREGDRMFDASLMLGADGKLEGISKMVHIAQVPGFYEQDYYSPSDTGFLVHDTLLGKIGIVVCFDRHFPESIRTCVLRGAWLILIPTANTIAEPRDLFECEVRAAALQNGVYIAMCNRVGTEGEVAFCGESIVVGPDGNVVAKGGSEEALVIADIELDQVTAARVRRPYLALRRPEMYEQGKIETSGLP